MDMEPLPIRARRNAPWADEWTYTAEDSVSPFDFGGATAWMEIRQYGAQPGDALARLELVATPLTEGLRFGAGAILPYVSESTHRLLPGDGQSEVRFAYDVMVQLPGRVAARWRHGIYIVAPGRTFRMALLKAGPSTLLVAGSARLIAG